MNIKGLGVLLVCGILVTGTESAVILMIPIQLHSHISNFVDIGMELIKNGHQVYTLSYKGYREVKPETGIKTLHLPCKEPTKCTPEAIEKIQRENTVLAVKHKGDFTQYMDKIIGDFEFICSEALTDNAFFEKLENIKFDLAFVDGLFSYRCMYLIPHRLGIPWVTLSDLIDPLVPRLPWLPSFVPHPLTAFSSQMTFTEKLQNIFAMFLFRYKELMPPPSEHVLNTFRQYGDFSSLVDLEAKSLLWLLTEDEVIDYAKPQMPNVINVGGLSTKAGQPLNKELQSYADNSKHGLIVVSFGSYLVDLPDNIAEELLKAFKEIKEDVIWRFENKNGLSVPKNVKLYGWLPQNDLLAHEKVKLFITHGGKNGIYEGLYHAKPMIAMPIAGDQFTNAAIIENLGLGLSFNMHSINSTHLQKGIKEVISNPKYKINIEKASDIFHGREKTPSQRAAFWIDHVLTFGGSHLRSHALDLPVYKYFMLDILSIFLAIIIFTIIVVRQCIKYCCKTCCHEKGRPHAKRD